MQIREIESGDALQLTSNTTQITVTNLHPFYNYNCSVAAETVGIGPYSERLSVQLNEYSKILRMGSLSLSFSLDPLFLLLLLLTPLSFSHYHL